MSPTPVHPSGVCLDCPSPVRATGPPASMLEAMTGRRMYCLTCLLAVSARREDPDA